MCRLVFTNIPNISNFRLLRPVPGRHVCKEICTLHRTKVIYMFQFLPICITGTALCRGLSGPAHSRLVSLASSCYPTHSLHPYLSHHAPQDWA